MRTRATYTVGLHAVILLAAGGCATIGTTTIRPDRFHYNEAGAESSKEQLLLNLVRLRYGEPVYFLDIGSMLSQRTFEGTASASKWENGTDTLGPWFRGFVGGTDTYADHQTTWGGNLTYSDRPTISYTPVQGEQFARQFMTPIPLSTLIYLSKSGWSVDRLLELCVQKINSIANLPTHDSGGENANDFDRFDRAADLMKTLQDSNQFEFSVNDQTLICSFATEGNTPPQQLQELCSLLNLAPDCATTPVRVTPAGAPRQANDLAMQTRSLLAMMYSLAQRIPVPEGHERDNQVQKAMVPQDRTGRKQWLSVQYSRVPQIDSFVQIYYNGYWFYISKNDWSSKRTFALITYLLSLQASPDKDNTLSLTVPAGK
jgi:hypothetical protein